MENICSLQCPQHSLQDMLKHTVRYNKIQKVYILGASPRQPAPEVFVLVRGWRLLRRSLASGRME